MSKRPAYLRLLSVIAATITAMNVATAIPGFVVTTAVVSASSTARAQESEGPKKSPPPLTMPTPADAPDKNELEADKVDPRRQKFLSLFVGIEHHERLPYIPPNAIFKGDYKKLAKVAVNKETNTLSFAAIGEGVATLTIHNAKGDLLYDFRLDARRSNLTKVACEMQALLSDVEGISIKIINNKVVVDGQVLLPKDLSRVISVVMQFGEATASSLVTLSPMAAKKIAMAISNDINNPEITVRAVNDKFILEGSANDPGERDRADAIAQVYVPDIVKEAGELNGAIVKVRKSFVVNLITVKAALPPDPGKIIQLVVHYVELNKNYEKSFRFQFTPTLKDDSTVQFVNDSRQPGGVISTITGTVSNLLPKLNWAKTHGNARVLQSSSLIVLDGQKGDLKNVVKMPYSTISKEGQSATSFEDVGFITSITPKILNARSDSIRLAMDFSMKAFLGLTDSGPMVSNNSMQTTIIVRSGQSAAVGGLISNSNGTDYNKLPKGTQTDPLISLYASKSFQRNQSQFVVFVTPIIKASASQGSEKIKAKFRLND